jgi:hypothetical protein
LANKPVLYQITRSNTAKIKKETAIKENKAEYHRFVLLCLVYFKVKALITNTITSNWIDTNAKMYPNTNIVSKVPSKAHMKAVYGDFDPKTSGIAIIPSKIAEKITIGNPYLTNLILRRWLSTIIFDYVIITK